MPEVEIGQALSKHRGELEGLSKSLLDGNAEGFTQGIIALLTNVATGVPLLGALAKQGVAKAFALSSAAKLRREIEAIERQEDRQQFADQVSASIEELIGQALIQLLRTQQRASSDVIDALGGLREEFEAFRTDFAHRVTQASVVVDQILVSGEGIGIRVTSRTEKSAKVGTLHVSGKGVGIELG